MTSIFDLKTSPNQLSSVNMGMSNMTYDKIPPMRDIGGSRFPGGQIVFRWEMAGQKRWIPNRSFLRFRFQLSKADGTQLVVADNVAPNMALVSSLFQSMEFRINDKTVSRIGQNLHQVDTLYNRMNKSKSWLDGYASSTNFYDPDFLKRNADVSSDGLYIKELSNDDLNLCKNSARLVKTFECIYQPSLSIFQTQGALPCCKFELVLVPNNESSYKKTAIESIGANKVSGVDFDFNVVDGFFYGATVNGPRMDNGVCYLDLEQIRCQTQDLTSASFGQRNFDVSPSTYQLTVGFQDKRVLSDSRFSSGKLKSYNQAGDQSVELNLNRFFVNYAGTNRPQQDADPSFVAGSDYTLQMYNNTQLNNGAIFDSGSPESLEDWKERGAYYSYSWPRDSTDRSTRVNVHNQFENGTDITNTRVLLFDHSKQVCMIRFENGRVVDCAVEDC